MPSESSRMTLRFVDEAGPTSGQIPAAVLAAALIHGQRAVHILAMMAMGKEVRERLRVPTELAREFTLVCEPTTKGSYKQPVMLEGTGLLLDLPSRDGILATFSSVGATLSKSDWNGLREMLPDRAMRNRLVDEYVAFLPNPESGFGLELQKDEVTYASFTQRQILAVHEFQRKTREPVEPTSRPVSLIGELVRIDFGGRKLTIKHVPSSRLLDCEYSDDVEEMLLDNRRGLIQVSGLVELDASDQPVRLTDVFDIKELDLSPISIDRIQGAVRHLRFVEGSRSFAPFIDEDGQFLVVEDPELDLHVYSSSRTSLVGEIMEQIEFLWLEYVETSDELTPGAQMVAERLSAALEVVTDA